MKICAIRLQEVGIFRAPVAIEGFSGGLDVLAGPNELGKSTLLRALQAGLFQKHSARSREIEALRPASGGAPLIEIDFESGNRRYRLRKRFLAQREAVLKSLDEDLVLARGEDVEAALCALRPEAAREGKDFDLLWVRQGGTLRRVELEPDQRHAILSAIEAEVAAVSSGSARLVREHVERELGALVTDSRQQPKGDYLAAIKTRDAAVAAHALSHAKAAAAHDRLEQLGTLRRLRATLADTAAVSARERALAEARSALEAGRAAREQLRLAGETRIGRASAHDKAVADLAALEARLAEAADLEARLGATASALAETEGRLRTAEADAEAARARREAAAAQVSEARRRLRDVEREERRRDAAQRLATAAQRLAQARAAQRLIEELRCELAAQRVTASLLAAAEREQQAIERGEARLAASAPSVAIAYAPGGEGRIRLEGRALRDGELLRPDRPIVLEIPGIGRIAIAPGVGQERDALTLDLDGHRAMLAEQLEHMAVADLAAAQAALERRRGLEAQLTAAEAGLAVMAPQGAHALQAEVERWQVAAAGEARLDLPARAAAEADLARLEAELAEAASGAAGCTEAQAAIDREFAGLLARRDAAGSRHATLSAQLPPAELRKASRLKLTRCASEAEAALNEAVRSLAAWAEAAPSDERYRALEAEAQRCAQAEARAREEIADIDRRAERIDGELSRDQAEDVMGEAEERAGELAAAEARVERFEAEAAALRLVARTLEEASAGAQARTLPPVLDRLRPYLSLVFPEAEVELGENFAVAALRREGNEEPLPRLSDGTQEQIAVLARLGLGRLLADTGAGAPMILDDALVYSDDRRIARLFKALELAAEAHQVIVLTCRERTFEALGGRRLSVREWAQ